MSEPMYLATILIPFVTVLLVFGMKYFASIRQAHVRLASDEAYQQLAASSARAQAETAQLLAALNLVVSRLGERMESVEVVLKQLD